MELLCLCGAVCSSANADPATFCTHKPDWPPENPPLTALVGHVDYEGLSACVPIDSTFVNNPDWRVDVYCGAGQDANTTYPTTAWCVFVPGIDQSPCLAPSYPYTSMRDAFLISDSVTTMPDGTTNFCANFQNASKKDKRYFNVYATITISHTRHRRHNFRP
jgi:hypothetical protein